MRNLVVLAILALILAVPFALRPKETLAKADDVITIVTPHNEQIRHEFGKAFGEYYKGKTGRSIYIDWRMPGGTNEISRYIKSEYYAAFQRLWESSGKAWTTEVAASFDNPQGQSLARQEFLASDVGIGIDIFFGGGAFEFFRQAEAGRLVDNGLLTSHPEWFGEESIPYSVSGEIFYDREGRWIATALSSFGICYNSDSLSRLAISRPPATWADLGDPRLFRQVLLADPTQSGSAAKAFEMIIQQQIQEMVRRAGGSEETCVKQGWISGLQIIQRASANARYFTDAASQVPIDVSLGEAAVGMCIDFYGRFQSQALQKSDTPSRLQYRTPAAGSSLGPDPIALFRGAPNPTAAKMFIEFVLSLEGQRLWHFKVGVPGGPRKYALRRQPVRKELYLPEHRAFRSDPEVDPYEEARLFSYDPKWTSPLFKAMSFIIRVMCLDSHHELTRAWKALLNAGFPPQATATFENMDAVNYEAALKTIRPALTASDRIEEVRLARELGERFRAQYRAAEELAKSGK
ncbi:MAG TPA: extracellular solute-binding protein [Terrimicrobiaceae bacterium]